MSTQNSGRSTKSFSGNGTELPHMQSSLSPQGFGLYNGGGGGDAPPSIFESPIPDSIASGGPLKKQTISYQDYVVSHPQHDSSNISAAMQDGSNGSSWNSPGNENLTASHSTTLPSHSTTIAPSFDSKSFGILSNSSSSSSSGGPSRSIIDAKALEKSQHQQRQHYSSNNSFTGTSSGCPDSENREHKKERLIDSLSTSDMITCLPGFKKGPGLQRLPLPPLICGGGSGGIGTRFTDKVTHHHQQRRSTIPPGNVFGGGASAPLSTVSGRIPPKPLVSPQLAVRNKTPANNLQSILNFQRSIDGGSGRGAGAAAKNTENSLIARANPTGFPTANINSTKRITPPASPITRAQQAIGRAQSEISKITSFVENEENLRKPPGAWKNMGTPFFSEPLTKSAQRQQKAQYRNDLEQQILAAKLRKAEQERKERDSNDHPLGPEYAHPALTYYNPPQKIIGTTASVHGGGPSSLSTSSAAQAAAAITKYMKEKYALEIGSGNGGGPGNTIGGQYTTTSGYPQETTNSVGGRSTTALGRVQPLEQTKKERALANLMKSRMHPGHGDQNQWNKPNNNGMPANGHQQQNHPFFPAGQGNRSFQPQQQQLQQQYPYPPRPPGHGGPGPAFPITGWPAAMPMYAAAPAYPPFYGAQYAQPPAMYQQSSGNQQQMVQHQQQHHQVNYPHHLSPSQMPQNPIVNNNQPRQQQPSQSLRSILHDRHNNEQEENSEEENDDDQDDPEIDFETLKEHAYKAQKIWQTSDELPDPGLRTAVYKAELRKQIDEDRKRKAERLAREREEDERIERKIREFHEEERRRLKAEQLTRAELEGYHRQQQKLEKQQRKCKNEAFTVSRHGEPRARVKEVRPRSRSSVLAEKLASFGGGRGGQGDFRDGTEESYGFYENRGYPEPDYLEEFPERIEHEAALEIKKERGLPTRKKSPPVPVVQKKLIENLLLEEFGNENWSPGSRSRLSSAGQGFLFELKSKLKSERDLVERRLKEKIESTHKNMNLLKYTMNHAK